MAAIFACIVQPKVIEFNVTDHKLHRAQKDEELRSELQALTLSAAGASEAAQQGQTGPDGDLLCQPGGGCRVLRRDASVKTASVGSAFCIFEGSLSNAAALAETYAPVPEDEPSPAATALSSAELVCRMYAMVGVEMLGLLRGSFTFVLYESKTSRVLAARDGAGHCPLLQARTPRDSLVLSNSRELLEGTGCHDLLEFLPGDFKYGWSAIPRRYQPADPAKLSRRSVDISGPSHHHSNHYHQNHHHHGGPPHAPGGQQQPNIRGGSRRTSLDHHDAAPGGGNRSRRTSLDHQSHQQQQQQQGSKAAVANGSPSHQHPHRTYVVSAEDPRIIKAAQHHPPRNNNNHSNNNNNNNNNNNQQQQQQQTGQSAVAGAEGGAVTASAGATATTAVADKAAAAADGGRVGSGRAGAQSGHHHHRRRSMDNHGAWRLGAGQAVGGGAQRGSAVPAAAPAAAAAAEGDQPRKQQSQPGANAGGAAAARHDAPGRRRSGRQSHDGRTPTKQQQQQQQAAAPKDATPTSGAVTEARTDPAGEGGATASPAVAVAALRVDAPAFTPPWAASSVMAANASPPPAVVAVGGSP